MELPRELEDAIVIAPDDRVGYSVAADWLQQAGAVQGELVALSLADKTTAILDRVTELKRALLPPEMRTQSVEWRWGFVRGIAISSLQDGDEPRMLRDLLVSPLARFVQKLVVYDAGPRLADAILDAATTYPRALRCLRTLMLFMGDFRRHPLDLAKLSSAAPALRRLVLRVVRTRNALALSVLEELVLDSNAAASAVIARSTLPRLDTLQLANAGIDRDAPNGWLLPARLPALRAVGLTDDGELDSETWTSSEIAPQLEQLDLYVVQQGVSTERRFIIDRRPRGDRAALLVMVGRTHEPGTSIPIDRFRFPIGSHAAIQGGVVLRTGTRDIYVNGHSVEAAPLRTYDEVAIADDVFRYIEGDVEARAAELRARYGL